MGSIVLRRGSDDSLICEHSKSWTGWSGVYVQPDPVTIAGVHILTKHAVKHWEGTAIWYFAGTNIDNLWDLDDYVHDLEVLTFTDFGGTYDVQGVGPLENIREEEFKHFSLYAATMRIRRVGYRI